MNNQVLQAQIFAMATAAFGMVACGGSPQEAPAKSPTAPMAVEAAQPAIATGGAAHSCGAKGDGSCGAKPAPVAATPAVAAPTVPVAAPVVAAAAPAPVALPAAAPAAAAPAVRPTPAKAAPKVVAKENSCGAGSCNSKK